MNANPAKSTALAKADNEIDGLDDLATTLSAGVASAVEAAKVGAAMRRTADSHRESLYKGTTTIIEMLEEARDQLLKDIKADLILRGNEHRVKIQNLDVEQRKALALAENLAAQATQERMALEEDTRVTNERITLEEQKFNVLIGLQRTLIENLR